jgi:hypothetical protein
MSNLFLKNELPELFNTTESSIMLPINIKIVDRADDLNATSSAFIDNNVQYSATSATMQKGGADQCGGAFSEASSNGSIKDINKLISMLTSESSAKQFNGLSETSTVSLEAQLRDILNQDGGKKKQRGGNNMNVDQVKNFFTSLKSQGVNVDVKLNDKSMTEFFGLANETTTDLSSEFSLTKFLGLKSSSNLPNQKGGAPKKSSKKASKKASKKRSMRGGAEPESQKGGKKSSKKASKKGSKKASKKRSMRGGNPGD